MQKSGFVYIWYDRKNKRYYIGCRWGNPKDNYICSSSWMKAAYMRRPLDFTRRILESNIQDRKTLLEREYYWLQQIKPEELGKRYYNFHNHKFNHWTTNPKTRNQIAEAASKRLKGKSFSPATQFKPGECRSPQTQFQKGKTPHNKGLSFEQRYGEEKGQQLRQIKSEKMKGRSSSPQTQFQKGSNLGGNNNKARAISTPHGTFDSLASASRELNTPYKTLLNRVRSASQPNWIYV